MIRMLFKHAPCRLTALTLLFLPGMAPLRAQQAGAPTVVDNGTMQQLLKRIDELEARVKQLEAERQPAVTSDLSVVRAPSNPPAPLPGMDGPPVSASGMEGGARLQTGSHVNDSSPAAALQNAVAQTTSSSPSDPEQSQSDNAMMERMDVSRTLLRIRGFGDISLHGGTQKGRYHVVLAGTTGSVCHLRRFRQIQIPERDRVRSRADQHLRKLHRRAATVSAWISSATSCSIRTTTTSIFPRAGAHCHRLLQHRLPSQLLAANHHRPALPLRFRRPRRDSAHSHGGRLRFRPGSVRLAGTALCRRSGQRPRIARCRSMRRTGSE